MASSSPVAATTQLSGWIDNGTAVVNEFQEHHYQSTKQQDGDVLFFESYREQWIVQVHPCEACTGCQFLPHT